MNRATDSDAASRHRHRYPDKTIQAGLFTEGADWRIKSSTMVSARVSGFRLAIRFLRLSRCVWGRCSQMCNVGKSKLQQPHGCSVADAPEQSNDLHAEIARYAARKLIRSPPLLTAELMLQYGSGPRRHANPVWSLRCCRSSSFNSSVRTSPRSKTSSNSLTLRKKCSAPAWSTMGRLTVSC